jgi:hypothetical protein
MSTSQLLRDLLGTNVLMVSSRSDSKILQLRSGSWFSFLLSNPTGLNVNNSINKFSVSYKNTTDIYSNITGKKITSYYYNDDTVHQNVLNNDSSVILTKPWQGYLCKHSQNGEDVYFNLKDSSDKIIKVGFNGICTDSNFIMYATIVGTGSTSEELALSRNNFGGALIDVNSNSIIVNNLLLPHSPIIINNNIYFLNSGLGQLCKLTNNSQNYEVIGSYNKFVRGICQLDDTHVAIGVSQGRWGSAIPNTTFDSLTQPGIMVVDITTGNELEFESLDVREIFDLAITKVAINV